MTKNGSRFLLKNKFPVIRKSWQAALEMIIICLAALWIGRKYLNFDPNTVVEGGEYFLTSLSHYIWLLLQKCGSCIFWNGQVNGGYPAFTELLGAPLHPFVIVSTLLLGVTNGSKVVILVCIGLIGFGQWWLAREMNLGLIARIWVSIMAMVGGHVFGRLQSGDVPLILSIASASLVLPIFIRLKKDPSWRNVVMAAVILALTWLSGQGYMQIIVILAYLSVVFLYLVRVEKPRYTLCKKAGVAVLLSVILVSILLVPLLHFTGNWQKILANKLDTIQPLGFSLMNLVINDRQFYDTITFDKTVMPWAHINYVGWIPIVLMVLGSIILYVKKKKRDLCFLWLTMVFAFVFSSRDPYVPFRNLAFVEQLRSINVGASLAIQPLLLLASITLQEFTSLHWFGRQSAEVTKTDLAQFRALKWLVLMAVMFFSIKAPYEFGSQYLAVRPTQIDSQEITLLNTESSQWVQAPNFDWLLYLLENDKKVIIPPEPWSWKDRVTVGPLLRVTDRRNESNATSVVQTMGVLDLIRDDTRDYATLFIDDQRVIPCSAQALGGRIDITCAAEYDGTLMVWEYYWTGWHAWMDGLPVKLDPAADFLTVTAPAGTHHYQFRYQPWDVYVGMGLSIFGIVICSILWWKKKSPQQ
jgi:hypothetical protein